MSDNEERTVSRSVTPDSRSRSRSSSRSRSKGRPKVDRGTAEIPSLFVRNINPRLKVDDIYDIFGRFGKLRDVHIPRDFHTGDFRGFGFVEFVRWDDADNALIEMHGQELAGKKLTPLKPL